MFKDSKDGQTNYCTHMDVRGGICDACLGKKSTKEDWRDMYPLNTFHGKTKDELVCFIESKQWEARNEVAEKIFARFIEPSEIRTDDLLHFMVENGFFIKSLNQEK